MAKKKVRPVPKGYHTVTPGLAVQGGDRFIAFCKKAFGAKEILRMPGSGGAVMHAELIIGDSHIMVNDEMPGMGSRSATSLGGSPVTLYLYVDKCDAVFKKAVAAGATVRVPMADQFWGDRMGVVVDPFGNAWGIATHIEDMTPREMKKRGEAWMKQMAQQAPGS